MSIAGVSVSSELSVWVNLMHQQLAAANKEIYLKQTYIWSLEMKKKKIVRKI